MNSFFWHDYESFGANPKVDRPSQFAGVRTDLDFNIIEEPVTYYCKPPEDYLPEPEACLITGITPQHALREGESEAIFMGRIHEHFSRPGTCGVGYNSIRFDDELTRFGFYRNFIDPYAREWQNGNSRWDIIDLVRLVYVLRPDVLNWPRTDDGAPSFRLEQLTQQNGLIHDAAHDAMSDVLATIALAKLIRERAPDLYDYVFTHKDKHSVRNVLNLEAKTPVLHVSSMFPASMGACSVVVPLAQHPVNQNGIVVYDLRVDPAPMLALESDEIRARVFTSKDALGDIERIPLKVIHLNKCPVVAPMTMMKSLPKTQLEGLGLDGDVLRQHLSLLKNADNIEEKISAVFASSAESRALSEGDPEVTLYTGGFFSQHDRSMMQKITQMGADDLTEFLPVFQDERLPELYRRYKARNFPECLTPEEHEEWNLFRQTRLFAQDSQGQSTF
ncbi:MAG: exodeoxyribonuclease I, partial [Pseudomonadales bacterium]|nr:exodeoxyribonuclease I [Pseudomonadales bacterium]